MILELRSEGFIAPPREAQRNWLLNKALFEFGADLESLNEAAEAFVPGTDSVRLSDRTQAELSDDEIMEDWQIPLMESMAAVATESHGDVLEIGFGRGIAASIIQRMGVKSHTIVECNESVIRRFEDWQREYPGQDIRLIPGRWQDVTESLKSYDGIFFHTFPMDENEYLEQAVNSITFAQHFFPTAARHLRSGGNFTYMTNEIDSLSRAHQRLLFDFFCSFSLQILTDLPIPSDTRDTWWSPSMVVIKAVK